MNYLDLIDDYLTGRINSADKSAFERRLEADPELKQEFTFHNDVVNLIKAERKNQLKAMLNSVPVGPSSGSSSLGSTMKAIGVVAGIGVLVTGAYFFAQPDQSASSETTPTTPQIEEPAPFIADKQEPDAADQQAIEKQEDIPQAREEAERPKETVEAEEKISPSQPQHSNPAQINTPNVVDAFENDTHTDEVSEPEIFTETKDFSPDELFNSNIEVIIDSSKKKFNFHYQYKDEKLYLFGTFDKGLYEILEFNNVREKIVIFYYKDNYYLINNHQEEITALKPIEDTSFTKRLDKLRE